MTDTFEEACRKVDEKKAEADLGAQLAAKLDQQRQEQETKLKELAAKSELEYDQNRRLAAKALGVRTETLDKEVKKRRRQPIEKKPDPAKVLAEEQAKFERAAGDLIHEPDILDRFGKAVQACGLIGEISNAKILYLAHTTRLFERPVSIALKGVSAGGKSFTVETVLRFLPSEAYFERTGMSEHALPYSNEDFQHRHIVIYEHVGMDSEKVSYFIRTLLSENRISYETVEKTDEGMQPRVIEKMGPTGIVTTTTSAALHPENETRLLSLGVIDTAAQTADVIKSLASRAASGEGPADNLADWQAYQRWLALGERRVVIPYAPALADLVPPVAVRLRRDFSMLLALVGAHTLLHRNTRSTDQQGRILATMADYAAVHALIAKLFAEGVEATVRPIVRQTVEAVAAMEQPTSLSKLARVLELDKNTVHNRVRKAMAAGFLVNEETKRGLPARLRLGDPLPEEMQILPAPEALAVEITAEKEGCWSVGSVSGGVKRGEERGTGETSTPGASVPDIPPSLNPLKDASNTPTVPSDGGNGHTVWPRAISNTPEDRQEPAPGAVFAKVTIRQIWPPGLGPPGDDVFDIDPRWRQ